MMNKRLRYACVCGAGSTRAGHQRPFTSAFGLVCSAIAFCAFTSPSVGEPFDRQSVGLPPTKRLIPHGIGIIDVTRHCLYSVPRSWRVDERPGLDALAWAPDGRVSAEQEFHPESSWTDFTSRLRLRLSPTVVYDDGATRFWVEHAGAWPGIHHYVAVPSMGGVCATQIDLKGRADDLLKQTVRQIVQSVGALE